MKFKPTPTSLLTALAFAWLTGLTWLQLRQHPTPAVDVHYTATQPAPLRGGRPVMGTSVNGQPIVSSGLSPTPGGTPYVTVQSDGSTYFGTRGPLLGSAGNLVLGGPDTTHDAIKIDYSGTLYNAFSQGSGTMNFGDHTFGTTQLQGATIDLWSSISPMQALVGSTGATVAWTVYLSGGAYFGQTPADPGANNLTVQGITNQAGGSVEAWRGIADVNFVGATSDRWIAYTAISMARTGTIPCTVTAGQRFTVVDASGSASGTNTITISASSGAIHGGTNVITTAYGAKDYVSDGTNCVNVSGLL